MKQRFLLLFGSNRHSYCLLLTFSLLLGTILATGQELGTCYHSDHGSVAERPDLSTACPASSSAYNTFFKVKESFSPTQGVVEPISVTKEIKVRIIVINPDPGSPQQLNFKPADTPKLKLTIDYLNQNVAHMPAPLKYDPACIGGCWVKDERIRFKLKDIVFVTDATDYSYASGNRNFVVHGQEQDSVLNVYMLCSLNFYNVVNGNILYATGGWVDHLGYFPVAPRHTPADQYIAMTNVYLAAKSYSTYEPGYTFDGVIEGEAYHLFHEFGHALGLHHLYDDVTCNPTDPEYLSDIFNSPALTCLLDNTSSCDPTNPTSNCTNNTMNRLGKNVSPMQMGQVHRTLFIGDAKAYATPVEAPNVHPWMVYDDETWDFAIRMYQDVIVANGATLTIKCEVQMPDYARIVVEQGGKLIVDGGLLTSYHPKASWGGVRIAGNMNSPSDPNYQGSIEMKNGAIIENAIEGLWNFTEDLGGGGGGILKVTNSHFYNCWRSVALDSYEGSYGTYALSTNCHFDNTDFVIDNDAPFLARHNWVGGTQVTSYNTKSGILFTNCTFRNEIPYSVQEDSKRGNAIYMLASGIKVQNCTFDGFNTGINSEGFSGIPTRTTILYDNHFTQVFNSIIVAGTTYGDVRNNLVDNMRPNGRGIYLDNAMGAYVGCGNAVDGYSNSASRQTGIVIRNSAASGATVMDNQFTNLFVATQTQMDNPHLNISCNYYGSNDIAISVNPETPEKPYTLQNQGTGCGTNNVRAGNVFFDSHNKDISSYLVNGWQYYAFNSIPNTSEYPASTSGTVTVNNCSFSSASDPNSICDNINSCLRFDKLAPRDIDVWRGQYHVLVTAGQRYTLQGRFLFAGIIRGYSQLDATTSLQEFLETEEDDDARRLLIPLYIETEQYDKVVPTIGEMGIVETEMKGYLDYYKVVADLHAEKRHVDQLTAGELDVVTNLAYGNLEVSAYAKAILAYGYNKPWEHPVEEESSAVTWKADNGMTGSGKESSQLYEAVPNPSDHKTDIKISVCKQDAAGKPVLIIRNAIGNIQYQKNLQEGENLVELNTSEYPAGVYLYSFLVNGKVNQTKKLAVTR